MSNRDKIIFEFKLADLPMLADALMIAGNTAMMCSNPLAQNRCDELKAMIDAHIPDAIRVMDGEEWVEIIACLNNAESFKVYLSGTKWTFARYYTIEIGDKSWRSKRWADKDADTDSVISGLYDALSDMAPLSTDGTAIYSE